MFYINRIFHNELSYKSGRARAANELQIIRAKLQEHPLSLWRGASTNSLTSQLARQY